MSKDKISEKMKRIKYYQEECKLIIVFFAALSSVAVFFAKLFQGELVKSSLAPEIPNKIIPFPEGEITFHAGPQIDFVLLVSGVLFLLFTTVAIKLIIKIVKKNRNKGGDI